MTVSKPDKNVSGIFEKFIVILTKSSGSKLAIIIAVLLVITWSFSGALFGYSEELQSAINKGTTIITFLMVFIIQRAQHKDSRAIQLKLNELIAATRGASNKLVNAEELSEKELDLIKNNFTELSVILKKNNRVHQSHSVEETEKNKTI